MSHPKNIEPEELLKQHQIRVTAQRLSVISVFLQKDKVLTLSELSQYLGSSFDRITLYRTLNAFEENGLIHKIPDNSGNVNIALCKHDSIQHTHEDNHVHFKCTKCEQTVCLEEIEIPEVPVPKAYQPKKYNFLIEGVCDTCSLQAS